MFGKGKLEAFVQFWYFSRKWWCGMIPKLRLKRVREIVNLGNNPGILKHLPFNLEKYQDLLEPRLSFQP